MRRVADEVGIDINQVFTTIVNKENNQTQLRRPSSATPTKQKDTYTTRLRNDEIKRQIIEREERKKELEKVREQQLAQSKKNNKRVQPHIEANIPPRRNTFSSTMSSTSRRRNEEEDTIPSKPFLFETSLRGKVREKVMQDLRKTLSEHGTDYLLNTLTI